MVQESYAATVARHIAAIQDNVLTLAKTTNNSVKADCVMLISKSIAEIETKTKARMERSRYEAERRDGQELAQTARGAIWKALDV